MTPIDPVVSISFSIVPVTGAKTLISEPDTVTLSTLFESSLADDEAGTKLFDLVCTCDKIGKMAVVQEQREFFLFYYGILDRGGYSLPDLYPGETDSTHDRRLFSQPLQVWGVTPGNGQHDHLGQFVGVEIPDLPHHRIHLSFHRLDDKELLPVFAQVSLPSVHGSNPGDIHAGCKVLHHECLGNPFCLHLPCSREDNHGFIVH